MCKVLRTLFNSAASEDKCPGKPSYLNYWDAKEGIFTLNDLDNYLQSFTLFWLALQTDFSSEGYQLLQLNILWNPLCQLMTFFSPMAFLKRPTFKFLLFYPSSKQHSENLENGIKMMGGPQCLCVSACVYVCVCSVVGCAYTIMAPCQIWGKRQS